MSDALATIAPTRHAADWDNVGLLVGARDWAAARVLLTIDLTDAVLAEAVDAGVSMIVAYHPPLFAPFRRLTDEDPKQRLVLGAVRAGIAIHSPHTALDAAPGGVNDWLADGLGAGDRRALTPATALPTTEACKIITFCPADAVDRIRDGLSTAGAGRIEAYTQCSFATAGTGTFRGDEGTHPTVGQRGRLERLDEIRLEMVCSRESLPLALVMLREFHPYETPPVEVHALQARPLRQVGEGRRLVLDRPVASST
ncbi:MAG: Nif3-like dinuclear metal center hexameric protein, partial [Phycisphaerales bacterium]|nr:Nif3-like dinuclear metal center hexameric protein [Phycisphaerales bacterium]